MKNLVIIVLALALIATGGLAWDLSAALGRARQASLARPMQTAPLCAPCRYNCPAPPVAAQEETAPAQPPIPPSLVLRLARQGKACALDGEPNITVMQ